MKNLGLWKSLTVFWPEQADVSGNRFFCVLYFLFCKSEQKPTCSLALWDRIVVSDFVRIAMFSNLYNITYKDVVFFGAFFPFFPNVTRTLSFTAYFEYLFFSWDIELSFLRPFHRYHVLFLLDLESCFINIFMSVSVGLGTIPVSGEPLRSGIPHFTSSLLFRAK